MLLLEQQGETFAASPAAKMFACLVLNITLLPTLLFSSSLIAQTPERLHFQDSVQASRDAVVPASEYNAYDQTMIESLFQRARQLQELGSHTEAVALYREAIHILRINQGLYADGQIELLDAMIASEMSLRNWDVVDKHYAYMENLYRRLYEVTDPRLETGLQKIVSWHVTALNINVDGKRIEHLQQANKLFKLRLQIAQHTLHTDDPKLDFLLRNIEISERQLFLVSDLNREMQRRQQRSRQNNLLADLD